MGTDKLYPKHTLLIGNYQNRLNKLICKPNKTTQTRAALDHKLALAHQEIYHPQP